MLTDNEYYQNKLRPYHQWEIVEDWEHDGHAYLICVYCGAMRGLKD